MLIGLLTAIGTTAATIGAGCTAGIAWNSVSSEIKQKREEKKLALENNQTQMNELLEESDD